MPNLNRLGQSFQVSPEIVLVLVLRCILDEIFISLLFIVEDKTMQIIKSVIDGFFITNLRSNDSLFKHGNERLISLGLLVLGKIKLVNECQIVAISNYFILINSISST